MDQARDGGIDRRAVLAGATVAGLAALRSPAKGATAAAVDWERIRGLYDVSPDIVNLENGYWGVMAEPVRREFERLNRKVNRDNSIYARASFGRDMEASRVRVAGLVGADPSEIALTRGATEALQLLIGGYNRLKPGDAVLFADLDYDSMQYAMNWLRERRGVEIVRIALPEPATRQGVLDAYAAAFAANPKLRLALVTQISHRTGLLVPVPEIAAMAKARGIDVIVDAAHSIGQMPLDVASLGADFVGFNLHKWIGAPLGIGFLYIRKERLADIDRALADEDYGPADIRSRVHTGTFNFATVLTVPAALDLHAEIGVDAKAARLRALRDRWVAAARALPGVQVLTPDEPGSYGALTSFRLAGRDSRAENDAIVATLRDRHGILTVRRAGVAAGQCIRVTPALYTSETDIDRFTAALKAVAEAGPG